MCVVGNYESEPFPTSLAPAFAHAVRALQDKYGIPDERVLLHRDCGPTLCPGKHLTRPLIRRLASSSGPECDEAVKAQHEAVIDGPYLFGGRVSRIWSAVAVVLVAALVSLRLLRRRLAAVRGIKPRR